MASNEKVVTDELVFEIADRLVASGAKISNRVIWTELGGGSMTTISAALRRWRERQELQADQPIERAELPASVSEAMHQAVARLWHAAQDETQKEIDALNHAANERVAEANTARDEALTELQTTAEELDVAQARSKELEAKVEAGAVELAQLQRALSAARETIAVLEGTAAERKARIDDLQRQNKGLQDENHQRVEQLREVQHDAAERAKEIRSLSESLGEAKEAHKHAAAELVALQGLEKTRQASATEEIRQARAEAGQARDATAKAREEAAELRGKVDALTQLAETLKARQEAPQEAGKKGTKAP